MQFVHSYLNNKVPKSFKNLWPTNKIQNPTTAGLRNSDSLFVPRHRLDYTARLPFHALPRLWNTFSEHELKQVTSPKIFKERLKKYFLTDLASEVRCRRTFCRDCFPNQQNNGID